MFRSSQLLLNGKHSNSHFRQELPQDHVDGGERVLLLVKTSMRSVWSQLPAHMFTTLSQFSNVMIYSDGPDSVGGIEVVDILAQIDRHMLRTSEQLMYYRIHRSLREKHVYIAPNQVNVQGEEYVDKFKPLHMLMHAWSQRESQVLGEERLEYRGDQVDEGRASSQSGYDWYVMIDDDSFLFGHALVDFLKTLDPNRPYYLGSGVSGLDHLFADGGSGVVLSRAAMEQGFDNPDSWDWVDEYTRMAEKESRGDYIIAKYLKEKCGISLDVATSDDHFQGEPLWSMSFDVKNWCKKVFSFHGQQPRDIELLWEYQRLKKTGLLYSDLYYDFIKPYFPADAQRNWDNFAKTQEFMPGSRYDKNAPYASMEKCEQRCRDDASCVMWRHDSYRHYCGLGIGSINLGRPSIRYDDQPDKENCAKHGTMCTTRSQGEEMVSGWFLDRVRAMRKTLTCDPLHHDPEAESSGYDDRSEGWWLRMKRLHGRGGDPLM